VLSFTFRPLYPGERAPQYPLDRRLSGPQSWFGRSGEKKILDPTGIRTRPVSSQSLYRLRYLGSHIHLRTDNICSWPYALLQISWYGFRLGQLSWLATTPGIECVNIHAVGIVHEVYVPNISLFLPLSLFCCLVPF
jgi:hypothetical protein